MSEKTHLDFNFLDENTKPPAEKKAAAAPEPKSAAHSEQVKFFEYFKECFTNFSKFAEKYLNTKSNPRYLLLVVWVVGVGTVADRVIGSSSDYSSWGEAWAIALFGGILSGALTYFIAGWFYDVRVGWSKGNRNVDTSRNIYIFSSLPIALLSILSFVFNNMAYGDDYFSSYAYDGSVVDIICFLLLIPVLIYAIRMGYKAAREVMGVEKGRAIWWFAVAPGIFYILIIGFVALGSS